MWQKLELEDIPKISPFLNLLSSHLSDFTIGGLFMWKDYFNIEYLVKNNSLFLKSLPAGTAEYILSKYINNQLVTKIFYLSISLF